MPFAKLTTLISLAVLTYGAAIHQLDALKRDTSLERRLTGYTLVFDGTGTDPSDRDASISGAGYIGYKTLPSYDVDACETYCNSHQGCVFVNLYYDYNVNAQANPQIRCAAYSQPHSASEKTNFGGQQLLPPPAGKSYVQQSTGYALDSVSVLANPPTPDGYELVFGPLNDATSAPGNMAYYTLSSYDTQACANYCNSQTPDPTGGPCRFFNIWKVIANPNPGIIYQCGLYYLTTDSSTATENDNGMISYSRGYSRVSVLLDGGFESYNPGCTPQYPCSTESDQYWTSTDVGTFHATINDDSVRARTGHSYVMLGQAYDADSNPGTITPTAPLNTEAGKQYVIAFWQFSDYNQYEQNSLIEVSWNGQTVLSETPGTEGWTSYTVTVTAQGSDTIAFTGGHAPSWDFLDDISVFLVG